MPNRSGAKPSLDLFLNQHSRLAILLVETDFDSAVAAYRALLESNGDQVELVQPKVVGSTSRDVFANPVNPVSNAVVGIRDANWTLIQHRFSELTFADIEQLHTQASRLHQSGRVLRFVAMGNAIALECDLTGLNHPKQVFYRVSDRNLRCSLVNEFDELAAEMGIEMPEQEGETISDFDELLDRLKARFVAVGCEESNAAEDQVTVAASDFDLIERVALLKKIEN